MKLRSATGDRQPRLQAAALVLLFPCALAMSLCAQSSPPPPEGWRGNYTVQQSVEFGGRFADVNGSSSAYNTFVDLHSGPRLLSESLEMLCHIR